MAHFHRIIEPGCLQHVISRFAAGEPRFTSDELRRDYLRRLGTALIGSDWQPLTFALMSTHTHVAMVAGDAPAQAWLRPLHTGIAGAINRAQHRFGPVFGGRARTIGVDPEGALRLLAYIHNNPVRAGLVRDPIESTWTAHRAFVGEEPPPPWLDVARALSLCGFDASPSGRLAFHEAVRSAAGGGRDPELAGDRMLASRRAVRRVAGAPVELSTPTAVVDEGGGVGHRLLLPAHAPLRPRWPGDARFLLSMVAGLMGVCQEEMQSRARTRRLVEARRVFVLAGWQLGRKLVELGALVGLSAQGATNLLRSQPAVATALAPRVAMVVRACWSRADVGRAGRVALRG